jgi:hypothetical protein
MLLPMQNKTTCGSHRKGIHGAGVQVLTAPDTVVRLVPQRWARSHWTGAVLPEKGLPLPARLYARAWGAALRDIPVCPFGGRWRAGFERGHNVCCRDVAGTRRGIFPMSMLSLPASSAESNAFLHPVLLPWPALSLCRSGISPAAWLLSVEPWSPSPPQRLLRSVQAAASGKARHGERMAVFSWTPSGLDLSYARSDLVGLITFKQPRPKSPPFHSEAIRLLGVLAAVL